MFPMANEAATIELGRNDGTVVRRTVAAGTTISGGSLCVLADPNTASKSLVTSTGTAFAGIASTDKDGNDSSTNLGFYTTGVFDLTLALKTTCTAGNKCVISGANLVREAVAAELLTGAVIGEFEETGSAAEVVRVRLHTG